MFKYKILFDIIRTVLKEIVEQKLPKLAKHLADFDIDLTTITFNWFIALFFDAVPFKVNYSLNHNKFNFLNALQSV